MIWCMVHAGEKRVQQYCDDRDLIVTFLFTSILRIFVERIVLILGLGQDAINSIIFSMMKT